MFWAGFILGIIIGSVVGMLILALCVAAKDAENGINKLLYEGSEDNERSKTQN